MADCLSRWAYPASKGMTDVSAHGDEAETAEAEKDHRNGAPDGGGAC